MASLRPDATAEEIDDEIVFQQTLLESLGDHPDDSIARNEIQAALQDLEGRLRDLNGTDSHEQSDLSGAEFPDTIKDSDGSLTDLDDIRTNQRKRSASHLSPRQESKRRVEDTSSAAAERAAATTKKFLLANSIRAQKALQRQRLAEEEAHRRRLAEEADAAYALELSQQGEASSSLPNPFTTHSAPAFSSFHPSVHRPVQPNLFETGLPSFTQTNTPRLQSANNGRMSVKAEHQENSRAAWSSRDSDAGVVDLTGDDSDSRDDNHLRNVDDAGFGRYARTPQELAQSRAHAQAGQHVYQMPGAFPSGESSRQPQPSIYEPQSSHTARSSLLTSAGHALSSFSDELTRLGNLIGNVGSYSTPVKKFYDPWEDETYDDEQTMEDIKNLMDHIRPDEEIPIDEQDVHVEGMTVRLKPYQAAGLKWLQSMEEGTNRGGILADDMGLGKTVQAIALMITRRSEEPLRKTNLVIAPVALLRQWRDEIQTKVQRGRHSLSVWIQHGTTKKKTWEELRTFDVVITTFGTVAAEMRKRDLFLARKEIDRDATERPGEQCIFIGDRPDWYRVIVDEAQNIKNRSTQSSRGACHINSKYRLCMTGTPMMNSVDELHALIRFLRIKPYNDWTRFQAEFSKPVKASNSDRRGVAMQKLQVLLKAILLRRQKKSTINGKPILILPERIVEEANPVFSEEESDFYKALETQSRITFNKYVKAGTVGRSYAHILVMLLRLRQACCHPHLIKDFGVAIAADISQETMDDIARSLAPAVVERIKAANGEFECPVCYDAVQNPAIFVPCGHDTCADCYVKIKESAPGGANFGDAGGQAKCPNCRAPIDPKRVIDHETFKKIHLPVVEELALLEGPADEGSTTASEADETDLDETDSGDETLSDEESENESLDGFVVEDDEDEEAKNKSKSKSKGKGKAKEKPEKKKRAPQRTIAELKKLASRNIGAKKEYLRRIRRDFVMSAKIQKTVDLIKHIIEETDEKIILFSQWTSLLDLLEIPIDEQGWVYQRYDGSMSARDRADAIDDFKSKSRRPQVRLMLVSLKAGNAGLNLNCASQVIILDPFWNPYIEEQAIDRAHRLGQEREVRVHRILIQETVEDRILALQERKRSMINEALDEGAGQRLSRLNQEQLAYLFGVQRALPST
ncbi:hypothetical protein ANO11243_054370 [Dothideomycetidae sp. 11243]|nr:hypothetical protein ANO11243_054370 [fungal sp. No.11243]